MHSEKAAKEQRALHPAQDYCLLCQQQAPELRGHRQKLSDVQRLPLEPTASSHVWRKDFSQPFPFALETSEDRTGNHNRYDLQRRQVHLGPSHYTVSERCSPCYMWREVRVPVWDPWLPSSTCVCERSLLVHKGQEVADGRLAGRLGRHSDCCSKREWYHHELPQPPNGGPLLAKVTSQKSYRNGRMLSEERYLDCVSGNHYQKTHVPEVEWYDEHKLGYNEQSERRHVTFEGYDNGHSLENHGPDSPIKDHCNGAFFSTEVPQSNYEFSKISGSKLAVRGVYVGETELGQAERSEVGGSRRKHRKNQGTVREQIKQVVTELEDVLSGLKQVQMEMKEVVQQIDVLTSNIDLGEEDQGPFSGLPQESAHHADRVGVVALVHNANRDPPEIAGAHAGVRLHTGVSRSPSHHRSAAVFSACPDNHPARDLHANPSSRAHELMTVESAGSSQMNHTSAPELQKTKNTANGDCLRARAARAKVKELQPLRGRTDRTKNPDSAFPPAPISSAKTKRPPPYPQNGLVKGTSRNVHKAPPYPGKQKQLTSTMV